MTERAQRLRQRLRATMSPQRQEDSIARRAAGLDRVALSFTQEQLWFLEQLAPGSSAYHIPLAWRLCGPLDVGALERALTAVLARHESLRTRFVTGDGQPWQVVDPPPLVRLGVVDLGGLAAGERTHELGRLVSAQLAAPFRWAQQPPLRALLVRLADTTHVLLVTVHHIIFDGWSAEIFRAELLALYEQFVTGRPAELAEPAVQYADFALWQRAWLGGARLRRLTDYWCRALDGAPTLELPADHPRPAVQSFAGAGVSARLDAPALAALRELCRSRSVTLFMTLLAAFAALLSRYSGQRDLVVGIPHANRDRSDVQAVIGYFVNMLPVRVDLSGDPSFVELLERVKAATLGAFAHQDLPFAKIVDVLRLERDPSRSPLFDVSFSFATAPVPSASSAAARVSASGLTVGALDAPEDWNAPDDRDGVGAPGPAAAAAIEAVSTSKFDLGLFVQELPDRLECGLQYASALFEPATARRMLRHFRTLLGAVVADPHTRVSELRLLDDDERRELLVDWNTTTAPVPAVCLHELVERQAAARPETVAVVAGADRVRYAELNHQADRLAGFLRGLGVGPEVLVGVCLGRSTRRIAAVLGVLKAGGAYVPLDPAHPADRLAFMIADSGLTVVLAEQATVAALGDLGALAETVTVVCLDTDWERIVTAKPRAGLAAPAVGPRNLAYVMYTSGSTGQPKGVQIEHRSVVNYILWQLEYFGSRPDDRVLQLASLGFDVSVFEIFTALVSGATLCLVTEHTLAAPARLTDLLTTERISVALLPPPLASLLAGAADSCPDLRILIVGGEACTAELVRAWARPGRRFYNGYGPTETTVAVTVARCHGDEPVPPIGRPMANQQVYVLDQHLNPVPVGVTGQLYVGGIGLARGYHNRPGLTAARFVPHPFAGAGEPGGRLYATGDLVRYLPDGNLVFLGRSDDQIKIRGFRVELGEIETVLRTCPPVVQAVVLARDDIGDQRQLVAYVTVDADQAQPRPVPRIALPGQLRAQLARRLPGYMVPAHVVVLDELPLTPTGKVDRAALPAPVVDRDLPEPETERAGAGGRTAGGMTGDRTAGGATAVRSLVAGLFAEVLGVDGVGAQENFFDLGGNSLQALRLVMRLRETAGIEVDVVQIFQAPTVAALTAMLDTGGMAEPTPSLPPDEHQLVRLTPGAQRDPVFVVHAVSGTVHAYAPLAHELADTHTLYGIVAGGLRADTAPRDPLPRDSVEDMAGAYLTAIRRVQPHGPYRIGGWSMGGLVAFEMARQLRTAGEQVTLLALLDTAFPDPERRCPPPSDAELVLRYAADAAAQLGLAFDPPPGFGAWPLAVQLRWLAQRLGLDPGGGQVPGGGQASGAEAEIARRFAVFRANAVAAARYRPPMVDVPALLIGATDSPNNSAGWTAAVTGRCALLRVPGDHYTLLRPPRVRQVAAALRAAWT